MFPPPKTVRILMIRILTIIISLFRLAVNSQVVPFFPQIKSFFQRQKSCKHPQGHLQLFIKIGRRTCFFVRQEAYSYCTTFAQRSRNSRSDSLPFPSWEAATIGIQERTYCFAMSFFSQKICKYCSATSSLPFRQNSR